jgi:hypothetical protein
VTDQKVGRRRAEQPQKEEQNTIFFNVANRSELLAAVRKCAQGQDQNNLYERLGEDWNDGSKEKKQWIQRRRVRFLWNN